jgi:hypothetical protein
VLGRLSSGAWSAWRSLVLPARTHAVRPLRREALRAVIEGPADRAGISVDADLVTRLAADTGGDALPMLTYTLAKLTDGIARGDCISTSRYEQLGGVSGALAGEADAALADAVTAGGRDRDQVIRELLRACLTWMAGDLHGVVRSWQNDWAGPWCLMGCGTSSRR